MRIHGLCLVKNEADVFEESMSAALAWCDHVYVFDNGSTDGTWELAQRLAGADPRIVPYKQDSSAFSDGLRADIFNSFASACRPGDWWCRLDADEFYIDDPRIFLAKITPNYDTVWSASFEYHFTDRDAAEYRQDPQRYLAKPVQQRLRYYVNHWSEMRFFRHRAGMVWNREDGGWPECLSRAKAYPVRIWLKHYQYRSPEQIEQRLRTRRAAIVSGEFRHEALAEWSSAVASVRQTRQGYAQSRPESAGTSWEERVVPAKSMDFDGFDRRYVVNDSLMPGILPPRYHLKQFLPRSLRRQLRLAKKWARDHMGHRASKRAEETASI